MRDKRCRASSIDGRSSGLAETDEMVGVSVGEEVSKRGGCASRAWREVVDFEGERFEAHLDRGVGEGAGWEIAGVLGEFAFFIYLDFNLIQYVDTFERSDFSRVTDQPCYPIHSQ